MWAACSLPLDPSGPCTTSYLLEVSGKAERLAACELASVWVVLRGAVRPDWRQSVGCPPGSSAERCRELWTAAAARCAHAGARAGGNACLRCWRGSQPGLA